MPTEVTDTAALALGVAVATFFAPCSYALLPGYVSYYVAATGEERAPIGGAMIRGLAAALGAITALVALSATALVVGEAVAGILPFLEYGIGIALILLGGWVAWGGSGAVHVVLPERRSSVLGFGIFGAMYALAATACVLPLFLALALQSFTMPPAETAIVLGTFTGGFGALMLAITVAVAVGHNLGMDRLGGHTDRLVRLAGVVLILAGVGQLVVATG